MAIDRIQPPSDMSPHWEKSTAANTAKSSGAGVPANAEAAQAAAGGKEHSARPAGWMKADLQDLVGKLKTSQTLSQTNSRISTVDQSLALTEQELLKTQQAMANALNEPAASYWQQMDMVDKARTINRLKDKVMQLQIERGDLVSSLAQQIQQGTYRATGEEIARGMNEEAS